MKKTVISKFMSDHSEGDPGRETLLDYELSWVLRMASDTDCPPRLKHQCRYILFKLLGIEDYQDIEIEKVHVWKQWNYIDVIADIHLTKNGNKTLHVLLIEDKAYSMMRVNQRDEYPKLAIEAYNTYDKYRDYRDYKLHQVLVTCFDSNEPGYDNLSKFISVDKNWSIMSVSELPDNTVDEMTESDLFNEFWLTTWTHLLD